MKTKGEPAGDTKRRPRVVFLHGFGGGPSSWSEVLLSDTSFDSVAPALTGHAGHGSDDFGDFSAVVASLAATESGPCHLVGYSMGARLALGWAVEHPKHVVSVTLIGVNPGLDEESARRERLRWDRTMADRLLTQGVERFMDEWGELPVFEGQKERVSAAAWQRQEVVRRGHSAEGLAGAMRVVGLGSMPSYWSALASMPMPLQMVTGQLDSKFDALAVRACGLAPQILHQRIAGVGHNVLLEAPRIVAQVSRAFILTACDEGS